MLTFFLALVLVLGFVTAFVWIPRLIDRRTESFQSDLVNRHYEEVENMYRTMRTWRHDYHNHIQAALAYLELGKYEELAVYLKKLDENLYEIDRIVKTGNLMADAILNSKLSLMREYRIRTEVTAQVPARMDLTDTELPFYQNLYRYPAGAVLYFRHERHGGKGNKARRAVPEHQERPGASRLRSAEGRPDCGKVRRLSGPAVGGGRVCHGDSFACQF